MRKFADLVRFTLDLKRFAERILLTGFLARGRIKILLFVVHWAWSVSPSTVTSSR